MGRVYQIVIFRQERVLPKCFIFLGCCEPKEVENTEVYSISGIQSNFVDFVSGPKYCNKNNSN